MWKGNIWVLTKYFEFLEVSFCDYRDCSNFKQEAKGCGGKLVDRGPCFKDFLPHKNEDPSTPSKARIPANFYAWRIFLSQQMVHWKFFRHPAVERPYKKRVWKLLKTRFMKKSSRCLSRQKVEIDPPLICSKLKGNMFYTYIFIIHQNLTLTYPNSPHNIW